MTILKGLVLLFLTACILGGSAFFAYELYWKPRQLDLEDKRQFLTSTPTPTPDFSLPDYEKAMELKKAGDTKSLRVALRDFLLAYPDSTHAPEAKNILGEINTTEVFSPEISTGKQTYTVASGDSLVRIASRTKVNPELIYRANNLDTINLRIGQKLLVPQLTTSLEIDRAEDTVTVLHDGAFFKEYPTLGIKTPGISSSQPLETKVGDKIALHDSTRIAFGDKAYADADRWIMLSAAGIAIRAMPADGKAPPGIIVAPEDLKEIFLLVTRGTPVTIK